MSDPMICDVCGEPTEAPLGVWDSPYGETPIFSNDVPALMEAIGAKREYIHADERDPTLRGWVWVWCEEASE